MKNLFRITGVFALAFILGTVLAASGSMANKITLQLADGNFVVEGELLEFDGSKYTIQSSELGRSTFEANRFICIDGACPKQKINPFSFHSSTSDFNIHGSNTIGTRLMPWIIRGYAKSQVMYGRESVSKNGQEVRFSLTDEQNETITNINLYRYGSGTAFPALRDKKATLGMSDRNITSEEAASLEMAGVKDVQGRHEHSIGIDAIVVIVSHKNRVSNLTMEQVADIFSGKITDWSEVGGDPGPITVYAPDDQSGTIGTFKSLVLKPRSLNLDENARRITENTELSAAVAKDASAIGLTGFAYIDKSKPIGFRTACGLIHRPSAFNVQTGIYPLSRQLYLYTAMNIENRHAVGLLNFAKHSPEMDSILNIAGFINRRVSEITFNDQRERVFSSMAAADKDFDVDLMRQLLVDLATGRRLSYTARFDSGYTDINGDSRQEFPKLINYLKKELTPDHYLIVAGFSDTAGDFRQNTVLSYNRAKTVRQLVASSLRGVIEDSHVIARGYGELLPSVCNDSEVSSKLNRRVEIWIVDPAVGKQLPKKQIIPGPELKLQASQVIRLTQEKASTGE